MPAGSDRRSAWLEAAPPRPAFTSGDLRSLSADVIVVGGGLAGLCTAWRLAADGRRVGLIEAGEVGGRTTGHSTAKLTALQGTTYSALSAGKGSEAAAVYAAASLDGVNRLRDLIIELGIDCSLTDAPAYTCTETDAGRNDIEAEVAAATAAGLPVEYTESTDLPFPIAAAVRLDSQAHLDPVALCRGLADRLRERGVQIVEGARVTAIEEERSGCTVRVGDVSVSVPRVVITTHLPIADPALLAGRTHPDRSYALAGVAPAGSPSRSIVGMYLAVDADWSIRPWITDGGGGLVVGGEGHSMQDHVETSDHYARLKRWATQRLQLDVRHTWSAFDYMPADGVPFIGRLSPRSSRRFVATGFRKWGISTSMVAAQIIGDLIADRPHHAYALFDACRLRSTVTRDGVMANARVARHFVGDRLHARGTPNLGELGRGEGRVVRVSGRPVAAARSMDGVLHTVKATCTHLGCLVEFNGGEQTWDCPCHGSRFALDGSVIDGPACEALPTVVPDGTASG